MTFREIFNNGLWKNNPGLVQLIGLCPLLATSTSVVNALGLGLATMFVLAGSNVIISLLKSFIPHTLRLPIFIFIIATFVMSASLLMEAFSLGLYSQLGLFFALITTNCTILARAESFAYKQPVWLAFWDGMSQGLGFMLVLLILGILRETLGQGTFFTIPLIHFENPFLLLLLPPGAFFVLGLLVAAYQFLKNHHKEHPK